jgi:hypothetical protein
MVRTARFLSLLAIAVAFAPALVHLIQAPAKLRLPAREYLIVQQSYRGWWLFAVPIAVAIASTAAVLRLQRRRRGAARFSLIALGCLLLAQIDFWAYTYPANVATRGWTVLPDGWMRLRDRWEYSHAFGAILMLGALIAAIASALSEEAREADSLR